MRWRSKWLSNPVIWPAPAWTSSSKSHLRPSNELFKFENVVFTSHYASCGVESYAEMRRHVSEQAAEILRGKFPHNLVNREVMNLPQCRLGQKEN
jgi:phosphoglycerate dehydrogenase-like enzyme